MAINMVKPVLFILLLLILFVSLIWACSSDLECPPLSNYCCGGNCRSRPCPYTKDCARDSDCSGDRVCCSSGDCLFSREDCPLDGGSVAGIIFAILILISVVGIIVCCCAFQGCPLYNAHKKGWRNILRLRRPTQVGSAPPPRLPSASPRPGNPQGRYAVPPPYQDQLSLFSYAPSQSGGQQWSQRPPSSLKQPHSAGYNTTSAKAPFPSQENYRASSYPT